MTFPDYLTKSAMLSGDERYRYRLDRQWQPAYAEPMVLVMFNPSTADAMNDDPTVRRCVALAKRRGFGAVEVYNLFAYRAAYPRDVLAAWRDGVDIVGPMNDGVMSDVVDGASVVMAAWGAIGYGSGGADWRHFVADRANEVMGWRSSKWHAFDITDTGHPRHPLYLPTTVIDAGAPAFEPSWSEGPYATEDYR